MADNYVVYHLHTELSLLDSCTNHKLYTNKAVELGQTAIGFSEHGNIYGWIEKKMYANEHGLKYLHGCEIYLTATLDEKIRDNYHTVLIAKNYEGFRELNLLIDLSTQKDHFYYKPRITFDEFFNISDNIIKISACMASPLNRYPSSENANKEVYDKLLKTYDYYEVQAHNNLDQIKYNKMLVEASKQYNKPLIAGTDTHSLNKYKAECRSILQKAKRIQYSDEDSFDLTYKSYDELVDMFKTQGVLNDKQIKEAINNTNIMAASVTDFELDTSFKYPILYDNEEEVFKKRINDMYKDKIKKGIIQPDPRYKTMVQEEMRVFKKIGMVGFMLFMSELVCWCWDNNIPIGYCRGSVGGSMIAYLTDIIDVNPLIWNTIFSRFANENRREIGDIDLDISPSQRHLVYEHIIEEYGSDKTAYVLAIGTIADKGAIDDISRALAMDDKLKDKYSLDNTKKIKNLYEEDPDKARTEYSELFYYFDGLVGTAVSQSMHPAGIIVSPVTLPDNYGTFWSEDKRILSINMEEIHEVSLVKYDLLGLKTLEIIKDCCELAKIPYPKSHTMNWEDQEVWKHITDSPVGIFEFESKYSAELLKRYKPTEINSLSLVNAALRPSGESYRDRLLAGEWNKNPSKLIDELLAPNHGYLIFQEDTIKFLTQICGLSGSEADNIRRAIGRKQKDRLEEAMPRILEGYCNMSDKPREVAEEEAKQFLQIIEDSASYQFGFNHSTGYSMLGYTCGYLRYYYPCEFITSYLNNANNDDDIISGTALAKQLGITISDIEFGHSISKYSCNAKEKVIYKGLGSIKYLSEQLAEELLKLSKNKYMTFVDLLIGISNTSCDSRQLNILICLNFFKNYGDINKLLKIVELYNKIYGKKQFKKEKLEELEIPEYIIKKYAIKETAKMYSGVDTEALLNEMIERIEVKKTTLIDKINYQQEYLGYISEVRPSLEDDYYYVQEISGNWLTLYQLNSGDILKIKARKNALSLNQIYVKQIIKADEIREEKKWRKVDGEWIRIDETEPILISYQVLQRKQN